MVKNSPGQRNVSTRHAWMHVFDSSINQFAYMDAFLKCKKWYLYTVYQIHFTHIQKKVSFLLCLALYKSVWNLQQVRLWKIPQKWQIQANEMCKFHNFADLSTTDQAGLVED